MARYLKLGGADLLHDDEDQQQHHHHHHHHHHHPQLKLPLSSPWPSLRRAHSSRERPREESPRRSVSLLPKTTPQELLQPPIPEQLPQQDDLPHKKKKTLEVPGFLRRVKSSREHNHSTTTTTDVISASNTTITSNIDKNSTNANNNNNNNNNNRQRNGFSFGFSKQLKQQTQAVVTGLPRAQSMRYNRIVSAESEEDGNGGGFVPPRHSCVDVKLDKVDKVEKVEKVEGGGGGDEGEGEKRMVRISACYQTSEGEILSIECSQCGRWLGTVTQRVNLDTGSLKLCQICYPTQPEAKTVPAGGNNNTNTVSNTGSLKKGSSFLRGLRKMLGLKKTAR